VPDKDTMNLEIIKKRFRSTLAKELSSSGETGMELPRLVQRLAPFLSGIVFLAVFALGYSFVPGELYELRDDGLITLSHAKNLVDFDVIGVNPAGERVEGFSSPLEFAAYFVLYGLFGISCEVYAACQTYLSIFFVGCLFFAFFKGRPTLALIASLPAATLLFLSYGFSLWHGSGMENALTHLFHLFALYLLFWMLKERKIKLWTVAVLFLASISRIEAIWHMGPIVFLFAVLWYTSFGNWRGFVVLGLFVFVWISFNFARYLYFGSLLPNTSVANGIDVIGNLKAIFELNGKYLEEALKRCFTIVRDLNFGFLLISLPFLYRAKKDRSYSCLLVMIVSLVLLMTIVLIAIAPANRPRNLCCSGLNFQYKVDIFQHLGKSQELFRPTVALPDLGIVSYSKLFNIIDVGRLGSPLVAALRTKPDVMTRYLLEYAAPDFLRIHGGWQKSYKKFLRSSSFKKRYERANKIIKTKRVTKKRLNEFWVRKDIKLRSTSKERILIDKLTRSLDIRVIESEINICSQGNSILDCLYVTRTVYRFLPELEEAGHMDRLKTIFKKSRTYRYDLALLDCREDGQWYKRAYRALNTTLRTP
jgi:hypothetical protein